MKNRRLRRRVLGLATLFAAVTALSGCGDGDPGSTNSAPASNGVAPLLQFSAPLVGGGEFVGADQAGRPTAFWFWAPT